MRCSELVRLCDIFAITYVPLHKGSRYHNTIPGGLFSIALAVLSLVFFITESNTLSDRTHYSHAVTTKFFPNATTQGVFELDTADQVIATSIYHMVEEQDMDDYFRVLFW